MRKHLILTAALLMSQMSHAESIANNNLSSKIANHLQKKHMVLATNSPSSTMIYGGRNFTKHDIANEDKNSLSKSAGAIIV